MSSAQAYLISQKRLINLLEITFVIILALLFGNLVSGFWSGSSRSQTGPMTGAVLQSTAPTSERADQFGRRPSAQLNALFGVPTQSAVENTAYHEELQETQLNLKLKGILLNAQSGTSLALIARPSNAEETYRVGDEVEGAEIIRIEPRRVVLRRNGITEALNLEIPKLVTEQVNKTIGNSSIGRNGIRRISDNERVVSQQSLRQQLNNLPRLLQQAKAVPHSVNGQNMGFKLVEIQAGSIFEDLGLQTEDVIQSVNGSALRTPEDALNAYRELRTSKSFQVSVLRSGRPVTLNLSVQ